MLYNLNGFVRARQRTGHDGDRDWWWRALLVDCPRSRERLNGGKYCLSTFQAGGTTNGFVCLSVD